MGKLHLIALVFAWNLFLLPSMIFWHMMYLLSAFGIFFSALLIIYNKGYKSANIYLGLFLFLFNFIILSNYLFLYNESNVTIAFLLSIPINASAFAIGPLAFLYVRSILKDDTQFSKKDWLHFILFAIIFLADYLIICQAGMINYC